MKRFIIIALVVAVIFPLGYLAWNINDYGTESTQRKADAAIVLGAAVWKDQPSPVFKERINHAIWLYRSKLVKKIIFTGARDSRDEEPASVVAMRYAMTRKVPPRDMLAETRSRTTRENIKFAADLGNKNHLKSYLIVSDPLHMKRAMLLAGELNIPAHRSPTRTSRYRSWAYKLQFLGRELYFYLQYYYQRFAQSFE